MTPTEADAVLFAEVLSCRLQLPVSLRAATPTEAHAATAGMLLEGVALVEDHHQEDKPAEEHGPHEHALRRLEAKADLMLALLGRLLRAEQAGDAPEAVHWSSRGLCVTLAGTWGEGATGLLSLPVAAWLPQQLELPVRVLATEPVEAGRQRLWLEVAPLTDTLAEALKRHLFRLHRRAIAIERRAQ